MVDDVLIAVEAITRGECVLCAGSRLGGGASLRRLVDEMFGSLTEVDPVDARRLVSEQPLVIAGYVRRRMRDRFGLVLRATARGLEGPPETPPALASLRFRAVLTTSYGDAIERAFAPRPVVRLLGSGGDDDVAFAAADVAERQRRGEYDRVRELFLATTFLIVGFERGDPDLALLLDHILCGLRGPRPHLAVIPGLTGLERDELRARFDLRVVEGELDAVLDAVSRGLADSPYEELSVAVAPVVAEVAAPDDPVEALLDEAEAEPDATRRAELLAEVARVFEEERADPDRAFTALAASFRLAAGARVAERLERLAEATGRFEELAGELAEEAARADDPRLAAPLYRRLGRIEEERLGRVAAALESYRRALAADPGTEGAWEALEGLARRCGDERAILGALEDAAVDPAAAAARYRVLHAEAPNDVVIATVLAELCRRTHDVEGAFRAYRAVLALAPERLDAARALADLLDVAGRDAELVPILDLLARHELDRATRVGWLRRLARAALATRDDERGFEALAQAASLAPDDPDVQREYGGALFSRGRASEAMAALGRALERSAPDLPPADARELHSLLGRAALLAGQRDPARLHLEAALQLDPEHPSSLAALLELGDLPAKRELAARRTLIRLLPPEQRFEHIVKVGERLLDDFSDTTGALIAWRAALEIKPVDHRLLHRCLDVLVDQRQWDAAVGVLDRLIAIEAVPTRRARYRTAAATIARDELLRPEAALRYLAEAVDDDPTHDRAVRALERLLESMERWSDLERHYARAIERLGPEASDGRNAERMRLWSALARLCLARPELRTDATVAFDVAEEVRERSEERLGADGGTR